MTTCGPGTAGGSGEPAGEREPAADREACRSDAIDAATVYVNDQAAALAWYTETLGMEVALDAPSGEGRRWLAVTPPGAPTRLPLVHGFGDGTPERVGTEAGIVLTAADVDATIRHLSDRGVAVPMPPRTVDWGWNAVFADTDGNTFVLSRLGD